MRLRPRRGRAGCPGSPRGRWRGPGRDGERMSTKLSGVGFARQTLTAAREAAKKRGNTQTQRPKRRTGTGVRRNGREPLGLGTATGMMMTERGMVVPAADGSVPAQFNVNLAAAEPELTGPVQAVAFDADTGHLDVASDAQQPARSCARAPPSTCSPRADRLAHRTGRSPGAGAGPARLGHRVHGGSGEGRHGRCAGRCLRARRGCRGWSSAWPGGRRWQARARAEVSKGVRRPGGCGYPQRLRFRFSSSYHRARRELRGPSGGGPRATTGSVTL